MYISGSRALMYVIFISKNRLGLGGRVASGILLVDALSRFRAIAFCRSASPFALHLAVVVWLLFRLEEASVSSIMKSNTGKEERGGLSSSRTVHYYPGKRADDVSPAAAEWPLSIFKLRRPCCSYLFFLILWSPSFPHQERGRSDYGAQLNVS